MKQINFAKIFWLFFYIFIFFFLLAHSFNYLDNDFGWHLKTGEEIINQRQVPRINHSNYTLNNASWVDHEWLMNASVFLLNKYTSYIGVNIFFSLLMLLILIITHWFIRAFLKNDNDSFNQFYPKGSGLIAFFFLLGIAGSLPHLGVRVQEIALLNLLLLLIIIYFFEKTGRIALLIALPFLFYFWSCAHASFLIGLVILFLWVFAKIAEHFLRNKKYLYFLDFSCFTSGKNILLFSLFSFLSAGATFITPYGSGLYEFLNSYKNTYYFTHIEEWLPIYYYPINFYQLIFTALATAAVFLSIIYSIKKNRAENGDKYKINLWQIGLALLFIAISIKARRHFPLLFIAALPFIIQFYKKFLLFKPNFNIITDKTIYFYLRCGIIFCFLTLIFLALLKINFTNHPAGGYCGYYPCDAVNFIKGSDKLRDLKLFNSYDWGGYLIWVWPEKQLFIDGRLPQYEFAGHTFLEEYNEFFNQEKIEEKLNQYGIQMVLLPKEKPLNLKWYDKLFFKSNLNANNNKNELLDYLRINWLTAYEDEISYVFIKK